MSMRKNLAMTDEYTKLRVAATALYYAGHWSRVLPLPLSPLKDAELWENLRDALGITPGTTGHSNGDD